MKVGLASLVVTEVYEGNRLLERQSTPYYYILDESAITAFNNYENDSFYDFLHSKHPEDGLWEDHLLCLLGTSSLVDHLRENPEIKIVQELSEIAPEGCQTIIMPDEG